MQEICFSGADPPSNPERPKAAVTMLTDLMRKEGNVLDEIEKHIDWKEHICKEAECYRLSCATYLSQPMLHFKSKLDPNFETSKAISHDERAQLGDLD